MKYQLYPIQQMKQYFLIFICAISPFFLNAQNTQPYCNASLSVELPSSNRYEIFIDGISYGFLDDNRMVENIPNGKRFIQIEERSNSRTGQQYVNAFFIVFEECQLVRIAVDRNKKVNIIEVRYQKDNSNYEDYEVIYPNNQEQNNVYNPPNPEYPSAPEPNRPPNPQFPDRPMPIPDPAFYSFIESVRTMSHDHSKLEIAEMGISANYFLAGQVKELLRQFSHDHTKLTVAKMAFHKTIDPQNYTMLFDCFSHDHSRQELSRYMRGRF